MIVKCTYAWKTEKDDFFSHHCLPYSLRKDSLSHILEQGWLPATTRHHPASVPKIQEYLVNMAVCMGRVFSSGLHTFEVNIIPC